MRDENSEKRLNAKKAADLLCGFFPRSAASDPEIFLAGLTAALDAFPSWVRERAIDPVRGIPADHSFLPDLAVVRKFCQALVDEKREHDELIARYAVKRISSDHHAIPPVKNAATVSALCEQFNLPDIPAGLDAIDITRMAAMHGTELPRIISEMLANPDRRGAKSPFARVVEKVKQAMEQRLAASIELERVVAEQNAKHKTISDAAE